MIKRVGSALYGAIVERRNKAFDDGHKSIVHTSLPVISVGNISSGGSGKTPFVQLLVRMLQADGLKPAIVMRGYKRESRGVVVVHDGMSMLVSTRQAGDEATLHASVLGIPVVVGEYKADAAVYAAGNLDCNVLIVDDGFQHRALFRDLDIVLIDRYTLDHAQLLPVGRLREPLSNLSRADIVVVHADVNIAELKQYCKAATPCITVAVQSDCSTLSGKEVVCLSAIANPQRFVNTAQRCGAIVRDTWSFRDHHWYSPADVKKVIERAKASGLVVVTTQKDAVKLTPMMQMFVEARVAIVTIPITMNVVNGANELRESLQTVFSSFSHLNHHL